MIVTSKIRTSVSDIASDGFDSMGTLYNCTDLATCPTSLTSLALTTTALNPEARDI
jgi:hypothetical protein